MENRIKYGKPILKLKYSTLTLIAFVTASLNIINVIYCVVLFSTAINIKLNVGVFINMVSSNDGNVLPILLSIPGVFALPLNGTSIYLLFKAFSDKERPAYNAAMYHFVLLSVGSVGTMKIICIWILAHIYSSHTSLHENIVDTMNNYSTNSLLKQQIDILQIQFQCCGSKEYQEWYEVEWYDSKFIKNGGTKLKQVPFSCCSMRSLQPCIHYNMEASDSAYKISSDLNSGISKEGCYKAILDIKKKTGWEMIGMIYCLVFLQLSMASGLRFVQTAHFKRSHFVKDKTTLHVTWLFGCYTRSAKKTPPPVPPVPAELRN